MFDSFERRFDEIWKSLIISFMKKFDKFDQFSALDTHMHEADKKKNKTKSITSTQGYTHKKKVCANKQMCTYLKIESPLLMTFAIFRFGRLYGGLLFPKSYVDMPAKPKKFDFLWYTNFLPNYPTISIPFLIENTKFCVNWVHFTTICSKYTQCINLDSFNCDENPPNPLYQIWQKNTSKDRHIIIHIPCQCENPPSYTTSILALFGNFTAIQSFINCIFCLIAV